MTRKYQGTIINVLVFETAFDSKGYEMRQEVDYAADTCSTGNIQTF